MQSDYFNNRRREQVDVSQSPTVNAEAKFSLRIPYVPFEKRKVARGWGQVESTLRLTNKIWWRHQLRGTAALAPPLPEACPCRPTAPIWQFPFTYARISPVSSSGLVVNIAHCPVLDTDPQSLLYYPVSSVVDIGLPPSSCVCLTITLVDGPIFKILSPGES